MYAHRTASRARKGFTLIEMLVVIGLLGALTALVLPGLTANREEALGDVCAYNQAGTVRVLKQYANMVGQFPADMHTALQDTTAAAVAMEGLRDAQQDLGTSTADSRHALTATQATSLAEAGVTSVAFGAGLNTAAVAADVNVFVAADPAGANPWNDDGGSEMTFDGVLVSEWATGAAGPSWNQGKSGPVVCLWIAPTTDWAAGSGDNNDWSKGNVQYGRELEGACPIPTTAASGDEVSFAYYMAYFKAFDDGSPARLIGTTCPEDGVMNP